MLRYVILGTIAIALLGKVDSAFCNKTSKCNTPCTCTAGLCVDQQVAQEQVDKCAPCVEHADCPGEDLCDSYVSGRCMECVIDSMDKATNDCSLVPTPIAVVDEVIEESAAPIEVLSAEPSTEYIESGESTEMTSDIDIIDEDDAVVHTPEPVTSTKCIESAWLKRNNVEQHSLANYGMAPVLCLPQSNLPCGTHGHLLNVCEDGKRELRTYREVCARLGNCVASTMTVSQISHAYKWSKFETMLEGQQASVSLTSVSAHPESKWYSISRMVAFLVHRMNESGHGWICNIVISVHSKASKAIALLRALWETTSSSSVEL